MPWGEKLLLKIAAACVARVMAKRQRNQTCLVSQKPNETTARRGALENRLGSLARVIHDGKRKYLVRS